MKPANRGDHYQLLSEQNSESKRKPGPGTQPKASILYYAKNADSTKYFKTVFNFGPDDICPISLRKIHEIPEVERVLFFDGRIYEKDSLLRWLARNPRSPITHEVINVPAPSSLTLLAPQRRTVGACQCVSGSMATLSLVALTVVFTKFKDSKYETYAGAGSIAMFFICLVTCMIARRRTPIRNYLPLREDVSLLKPEKLERIAARYHEYLKPFNQDDYSQDQPTSKNTDVAIEIDSNAP